MFNLYHKNVIDLSVKILSESSNFTTVLLNNQLISRGRLGSNFVALIFFFSTTFFLIFTQACPEFTQLFILDFTLTIHHFLPFYLNLILSTPPPKKKWGGYPLTQNKPSACYIQPPLCSTVCSSDFFRTQVNI